MANDTHPRTDQAPEARRDAPDSEKLGKESSSPQPPSSKPQMRHDLTGEFDFGVEGGQTQDHGQDRTDGTR